MLSGMEGLGISYEAGQSMFNTIGKPPAFAPSADAMEAEMKKLLKAQKVNLVRVVVKTYDLGTATGVSDYQDDLRTVMMGTTAKTHAVMARPPLQFVHDQNAGARYIAHLEWCEFELVEKVQLTVPSYPQPETPVKTKKTARIEE